MDPVKLVGSLVGGRYRVGPLIGVSPVGATFLAEHEVLRRVFVVLMLRRELADDPRISMRFQREARLASRLIHPNIVSLIDFGIHGDGGLFLVSDHVPGQTLRQEVCRERSLPLLRTLPILIQIAEALDVAHRMSVVHRDLTPDNVLLAESRRQEDVVKVGGFGLARILESGTPSGPRISSRRELYGTPAYLAPEVLSGGPATARADIYSLGAIAYELIVGAPPFVGSVGEIMAAHATGVVPPPSEQRPQLRLPPALDALVTACLEVRPDHRLASVREVKAKLQKVQRLVAAQAAQDVEGDTFSGWGAQGRREPVAVDEAVDTTSSEVVGGQPDVERLDEQLVRVLRDIAEHLRDEGLGSAELTMTLGRLVRAEERVYAEEAELAVAEAQIRETEQTTEERAARLRYAVIQLTRELVRSGPGGEDQSLVGSAGEADPAAALDAQIEELEGQLMEVDGERHERLKLLEERITAHRERLAGHTPKVGAEVRALLAMVEAARSQASTPELTRAYQRLDVLLTARRTPP